MLSTELLRCQSVPLYSPVFSLQLLEAGKGMLSVDLAGVRNVTGHHDLRYW